VAEAVRRCWLGAFDEGPLAFLARDAAAGPPTALPLVIQPLVAGAVSGVLFTVDPVVGDRSQVTVEAVPGLGSALVDGRTSPVRYALDKVTGALRQRAGTPAGTADRVGVDGRVTRQPVSRSAAPESLLDPDQLADLVATAARLEREFGHPVDVEWTVPESSRAPVYLQVRPLTGLPARRSPARPWLPERVLTAVREGPDS
jgi:pyruvate,water dikinase